MIIEIQGVKNGELVVPINNKLVRHTPFLATMCLDLIKVKPLQMCLSCPLVQIVATSFYDEIEIIVVSLSCCTLD